MDAIEGKIVTLRGLRVLLSSDPARLYGVEPKVLMQSVRRNAERFPGDFMFQLTAEEHGILKSQNATSRWGGMRRAMPYAFAEQGVAMLSSVLRTRRAIRVNVEIMRTFVRLRRLPDSHRDLAVRLDALEKEYDGRFAVVFEVNRKLMEEPGEDPPRERIGFRTPS